ncbi:T9SS type A sorting domain-containing protein [candidate division KSB1 bacterium]|nr:T9SS type A sorting domain-containing protein [candidate division KSB1 bacterium]
MNTNKKTLFASLTGILVYLFIFGTAQSTTIAWEPVKVSDLEGYVIQCGTESRTYSITYDVGNIEQYDLHDLETGCTYYFSIAAYDTWGNQSNFSPEVEYYVSSASDDTEPPELVEVVLISSNQIQLRFNEPVSSQSAQSATNYLIFPGVSVMNAVLDENETSVILTTSSHSAGDYLITVSNILDKASNPNVIPENTSLGYSFDATAVTGRINNLPSEFILSQNFPNPFNPRTTIKYSVKEPGNVRLQVYNVRGELVKTLLDSEVFSSGQQAPINWDATNELGMQVASGFYMYRLESGNEISTKRMQLVR